MKYMKIKDAKNIIFFEVATHGEVTPKAMRIFIEHRISKEVFDGIVYKAKTSQLIKSMQIMQGRKKNVVAYTLKDTGCLYDDFKKK